MLHSTRPVSHCSLQLRIPRKPEEGDKRVYSCQLTPEVDITFGNVFGIPDELCYPLFFQLFTAYPPRDSRHPLVVESFVCCVKF